MPQFTEKSSRLSPFYPHLSNRRLTDANSSQVEKKYLSPIVLLLNYIIMPDELSPPALILDHLIRDYPIYGLPLRKSLNHQSTNT